METTFALSHVSRRFRRIALGTPSLWSNICVDGTYPRLDLFLKQGREAPLDIWWKMPYTHDEASLKRRAVSLRSISLHRKRWTSLRIDEIQTFHNFGFTAHDHEGALTDFPALETLVVAKQKLKGNNTSVKMAFSSWNTPALKHLESINFIPHKNIASSLVTYNVCWTVACVFDQIFVDDLIAFLAECKSLECLSVKIAETEYQITCQTVTLPSLNVFKLEVANCNNAIQTFLKALRMPKLSSLEMTEVYSTPATLDNFIHSTADFASGVQSLVLHTAINYSSRCVVLPFKVIAKYFCNITDLAISVNGVGRLGETEDIRECRMPALRVLKVKGTDPEDTVRDVLAFLRNRMDMAGRGQTMPLKLVLDGRPIWNDELRSAVAEGLLHILHIPQMRWRD